MVYHAYSSCVWILIVSRSCHRQSYNVCGYTLKQTRYICELVILYNLWVLLNVYDHNCIVILFKHLIYLFCRRTLRRFGGNTDRFYLFRSHGFQCNLQEYCPNQQKNFSDCHHRITYCRFDIVNVSMIR